MSQLSHGNYRRLLGASITCIHLDEYIESIESFLNRETNADDLLESFIFMGESYYSLFDLFELDSIETKILIYELEQIPNKDSLIRFSDIIDNITDYLLYNPKEKFETSLKYEIFEKKFRIKLYQFLFILKD